MLWGDGWETLLIAMPLLGLLAATVPFHDVTRRRVATFAHRESLPVTPANAAQVVAYLATVRRWRGGGLVLSVAAQFWLDAVRSGQRVHIDLAWVFAGWFVGAVIAEWRVNAPPRSGPLRASLHRRVVTDYVHRGTVGTVTGCWCLVAALGGVGQVRTDGPIRDIAVVVAALAAVAVVLVLAMRRVVHRPQPPSAPDVLAADEAIRSRSLRALLGSALALAGYFGWAVLNLLPPDVSGLDASTTTPVAFVALLVVPLAGFVLATAPRRGGHRAGVAVAR